MRGRGFIAAAVLTTFLYHAAIGRINILDMPLAFFVCLAIWSGFRYFAAAPRRKVWLYLLYLFSALAFLAKGLIGIVFPFGVLIVWLIVSRRWRETFALFSPVGILLFAAITMPWLDPRPAGEPGLLPVFLHPGAPAQVRHEDA